MNGTLKVGFPLWARILAVVVGALVAAQVVTLALTVFFPPAPPSQYSLSDIEAALRGRGTRHDQDRPLVRTLEASPPSLDSPGWVVSPTATRDLAKLLGEPESDVRLLFYAPPPLAGAPMAPPQRREASRSFVLAGMVPPGAGMTRPGLQGGGFPRGASPGAPFGAGIPPSAFRGGAPLAAFQASPRDAAQASAIRRRMASAAGAGPQGLDRSQFPRVNRAFPVAFGAAGPMRPDAGPAFARPGGGVALAGGQDMPALAPRGRIIRSPLDAAVFGVSYTAQVETTSQTPKAATARPERPVFVAPLNPEPLKSAPAAVEPIAAPKAERVTSAPRVALTATAPPVVEAVRAPADRTLSAPATRFGFAPPSYVEGEFVAALKQDDGRWVTVRPQPEGFPNTWQRRVMLWFGLSVALIAPLALLLARRLAAPLKAFAESADRLGREPSADLPPLTGPAEIGIAAEAFNQMQRRIKRYVDDRTGMVRAISHDLRTPLARMRFKLERAPPSLRAAIGRDMDQMEQMIASVLSFMRDEMEAEARQVVDLRSLLEVVVDDAAGPVKLEAGPAVLVEIDVVAIQRVMENLIDNAIKYGFEARLKLETIAGEACVTVSDSGPGIPPDELQDVFKAYHRGAEARASGKSGVGLGLVVSRSTVRAHGGELTLRPGDRGMIAEVRLPGARAVDAAA